MIYGHYKCTVNKCCGCSKPFDEPRHLDESEGPNWSIEGFCDKCLPAYLAYLGPIDPINTDDTYDDDLSGMNSDPGGHSDYTYQSRHRWICECGKTFSGKAYLLANQERIAYL